MKNQKQEFAELDRALDEFLEKRKAAGQEIKTAAEAESIASTMLGRLLTRLLEGEMNDHLGYRRGEAKVGDNERNGHTTKRLKTDTIGEVRVQMPRDRQGRFLPRSVPKHKRRLEGFDEKILALYARGLTTREIKAYLAEQYRMDVSADFISNVTDEILPELEQWQNRPLESVYPVVFFDAMHIKMRGDNGLVTAKAVQIALGVDASGRKDVLGMWIAENETAKNWFKVFNELKARGVVDILIAVSDGLTGMQEAVAAAFPKTLLQTCIVHLIRNSLKFVNMKDYKEVTAGLKTIYRAVNADAAMQALEAFESSDLGRKYPEIGRKWRSGWDRVIPFFEFSPEVRRLIYTTNAVESLNRELRKVTKTRAAFPNKAALMKLLYLAVRNVTQKWKRPSPYWKSALRELAIQFEDRLIPFID